MTEVHAITSAGRGQSKQIHDRTTRYLISMFIRTLSFILAFVTDGPVRLVFVVLAFVLPYVAVMVANAGSERPGSPLAYIENPALPPGPADTTHPDDRPSRLEQS
ncbi:MAG: DUF3099 domain-containing protein [Actinomycetales bacterium]|nr:DUF3099 domain-containing protein [Actinomycetales bacterium]